MPNPLTDTPASPGAADHSVHSAGGAVTAGAVCRVLSVNVAPARRIQVGERLMLSAIHKHPVAGDVVVRPLGLDGDEQADLTVHGGLSKAVYAYPGEHYPYWRRMRAQERASLFDDRGADHDADGAVDLLPYGALGENLTLAGLQEHELWIGDRLVFARCTLRVSEPRYPCGKFTAALAMPSAARLMVSEANCGVYLAVDQPGLIRAGETFHLEPGPRQQSLVGLFKARMVGRKV
jgi:MOSC domain-containing protein YiiM